MLVKLPPGGNRENALQALQEAYSRASEARRSNENSALRPQQRHSIYLQWVDSAVYLLRHHISAADLNDLVLTKRYWTLQSMVWGSLPSDRMRDLVLTELEERELGLGLAVQRLGSRSNAGYVRASSWCPIPASSSSMTTSLKTSTSPASFTSERSPFTWWCPWS